MTLQLRPTFSESWYRVKDLAPRLRVTAQISRQHYRGERWYVVRDPAGNQYHRLSDAAYRFVGLLDGTRTVGEAWELVGGQLADDAPTQPEIIQILSQLYAANLVETNISPDATVLLRRHKKQQQRKFQGRLMNLLFPRAPIWDPDRFLKTWMPLMRPLLSPFGLLLWLVVTIAAVAMVVPETDRLAQAARDTINLQANPENALWLYATFVIVKLIHELGHGFLCRRFGGECHEMGIMLLVLIPCPYVDASSAWGFSNKWHRVLVGAGGMIFELFVAALAAFVWVFTNPESLTSQLAYNVMLIAGVSTILFNANPLLRYDGYYILSDLWEIPNLQHKSKEYSLGLIKRHIFRVKSRQPLPPAGQRVQLFMYAVTSTIYRTFIGIAIMLMVLFQLPPELQIVGIFMGLGAIATFFVVPIGKLFKYLSLDPELHRKRGRAWGFTLAVVGSIVLLVGVLPWPVRVRAEGIVEPPDRQYVRVRSPGFVEAVFVQDGQSVQADQPLLRLADPEVEARVKQLEARLEQFRIRANASRVDNPAQHLIDRSSVGHVEEQLADVRRRRDELVLSSPIAGTFICPTAHTLPGRFLRTGQEVATVDVRDRLVVYPPIPQADAELLMAGGGLTRAARETQLRLAGDPTATPIRAIETVLAPAATNEVRNEALLYAGGGTFAPDPEGGPQGGRPRTATRQYELKVTFGNPDGVIVPDQRVYVRVTLDDRPLIWQWGRRLRQLIQQTSA